MNIEQFKDTFIKGCLEMGGKVREDRTGIICEMDDWLKIKLHKNGEWIKAYEHDPDINAYVLRIWGKPKDIELYKGAMDIHVEGLNKPIEIPNMNDTIIYVMPFHLPFYISPEFEERYQKKRESVKKMLLSRFRKE